MNSIGNSRIKQSARDEALSFPASSLLSSPQRYQRDLTLICEGDVMLFDRARYRVCMVLMYSQIDMKNKNNLPPLPNSCGLSSVRNFNITSFSEGDVMVFDQEICRSPSQSICICESSNVKIKVHNANKAYTYIPLLPVAFVSEGDLLFV